MHFPSKCIVNLNICQSKYIAHCQSIPPLLRNKAHHVLSVKVSYLDNVFLHVIFAYLAARDLDLLCDVTKQQNKAIEQSNRTKQVVVLFQLY